MTARLAGGGEGTGGGGGGGGGRAPLSKARARFLFINLRATRQSVAFIGSRERSKCFWIQRFGFLFIYLFGGGFLGPPTSQEQNKKLSADRECSQLQTRRAFQ